MREEWHVYINIHLGRRGAARYRLQRQKTRRLRRRADYPHTEHTAQPSPRRAAGGWLRFVPGCLALTAVLFAAACAFGRGGRTPVGCRAEDFAAEPPLSSLPTAAELNTDDGAGKTVYLTFDDGPSDNTEKVLDLLKEAGVHASFFVVGAENNEPYLPLLARTLAEGHCIGLHSLTHEYRKIYSGTEAYWADLTALKEKLQPYCGEYTFRVLRFPGGSNNTVSRKYGGDGLMETLAQQAAENGYAVVDWNVSAEDSVGGHPSAATLAGRVIKGCRDKTSAVVLMHDSSANDATVEALPTILQWLQENGYTFDTVDHLPPNG